MNHRIRIVTPSTRRHKTNVGNYTQISLGPLAAPAGGYPALAHLCVPDTRHQGMHLPVAVGVVDGVPRKCGVLQTTSEVKVGGVPLLQLPIQISDLDTLTSFRNAAAALIYC